MALKYMRDNLKSLTWVLWATIGVLFGLVFFEWGGYNEAVGGDDPVAATVGGEVVTMEEFRRQYQETERFYQQVYGDQFDRETIRSFAPQQALDQLINTKILLIEAQRIGLRVSASEVRDAILDYPAFQDEDGNWVGKERYLEILRNNRMTAEQFESLQRQELLIAKLDSILAETVYISDAEVEATYREQAERASLRFVQLPASEFAAVQAGPAEVEAYFEDHREDYALAEQRVTSYILIDTVNLRKKLSEEISDEELRAYYEDNSDDFTNQEQVRARHILLKVNAERSEEQAQSQLATIRSRIEAGEDFAAVAREVSEDEASAPRGGDLGYFGRDQMARAFEEAAFGAEVNELVGPFESDFGFHLVETLDHREGGVQPFEQVEARVRSRAVGERVGELAEAKAKEVREIITRDSLTTPEQLQTLAETEELSWTTTEPFGTGDPIPGIGRSPEFVDTAFGLAAGGISEAIKVPRGWVILHLDEVLPPRTPELDEVRAQVETAAHQLKRSEAAIARLQEIRDGLDETATIDTVASELGLEVQESGEFGRFGRINALGANRAIIDSALTAEIGDWGGPVKTGQGAVLYTVTDRKTFDADEFEERRDTLRQSREQQQLAQLRQSLIEVRRRDLTPRYGRQVIETFEIQPAGPAG